MSSPTDQQLIQYIGQGRRDALAQLFDRYSADLYDYLARLVGDRDQAARILEAVMLRVPGAAAGFQARDSVRGWLYSLAREAGLDWLRQRGWLDGLPPTDEPNSPGLQGDVWKAARAMPAFFRAVLITEELQPLSPSEKARALGVNRTDLPRLIEEARRSFNRIYDAQARAEGRPTSDRIDPDTVWNARRRLPVEGGSLFGFLPAIPLSESLGQQIRRRVVEAMSPQAARPAESNSGDAAAAAAVAGIAAGAALNASNTPPAQTPPPAQTVAVTPTEPPAPRTPPPYQPPPTENRQGGLGAMPTTAIAALIGIALALLICGGVFLLTQNRNVPTVTGTLPENGQTIQQTPEMNIVAIYNSDRALDQTKSTMQLDGLPVTPKFVNNSIAWTGPLNPGSHAAAVTLVDTAGKSVDHNWNFFVVGAGTGTPPITGGPTPNGTPNGLASVTPIFPVTAEVVTITPIIMTVTPPAIYTPPPGLPTPTPCTQGSLAGLAFNDLNSNGVRDPNEPGLAGVVVNLTTGSNSVIAVSVTDTFGNYRFTNVPLGQYQVTAVAPTGWTATTQTTIGANLFGCGTVSGFNFGFVQSVTPIPPTAPVQFSVINVQAFVNPPSSNFCPTTFNFTGTISTNGAGNVTYQWVRSNGTTGGVQNLYFGSAGTQNVVSDFWNFNYSFTGWERLQVLSPNGLSSGQANFTLNCAPPTQLPTPPPSFAVTNVTASVSPNFSNTCPTTFNFSGTISTNGAGNVTYQWVRSDGTQGGVQNLYFGGPGTQNTITDFWNLNYNYNGWERLQVLSPNATSSNQANFSLNCATQTPSPTAPPSFSVVSANASVSPASSTTCPDTFTFNGTITANGSGNVTFQWVRSDAAVSPTMSLTFLGSGTQAVPPQTWTLGAPGFNFTGWEKIQVISPNAVSSPQATFTLNCPPPTIVPTDTPGPTNTPPPTNTPVFTDTPSPTLPPPFNVTSASAAVAPTSSVVCPQNYNFTGSITATGTGTATYQWEGTDSLGNNFSSGAGTVTFLVPGSQAVAPFLRTYTGPGPLNLTGGAHIHVMSPNTVDSPDANFTLNCP